MIKVSFVLAFLALVLWCICLVLATNCTAGFMGYPDVWKSEKAKKAYMRIAPVSFILALISILLLITA